MRVIHVIPSLSRGGAENIVRSIVRGLASSKDISQKICVLRGGNASADCDRDLDITVIDKKGAGGYALSYAKRLCRIASDFRADIIHSHLWPAAPVGVMAASRAGIPHVCHVHDMRPWLESRRLRDKVRRFLYRRMLNKSGTTFIACAGSVRRYICRNLAVSEEAVQVIHNGINTSLYDCVGKSGEDRNQQGVVVGVVGRLTKEKGQEYIIKAVGALRKKGTDCYLALAGAGSCEEEYRDLAARLGIEDLIEYYGEIDNMLDFYNRIDILAVPSLTEGLPLAVLEAMAIKIPVVTSNIGGIPEVITDGEEGFLVRPGDEQLLADAIEVLINDEQKRIMMGEKGRKKVNAHFSLEGMLEKVFSLYKEIMTGAGDADAGFRKTL